MTATASPSGNAYDPGRRRRAQRKQREKGFALYVPAEAAEKAGYPASDPPPFYRVSGVKRGSVVIQLYKAP